MTTEELEQNQIKIDKEINTKKRYELMGEYEGEDRVVSADELRAEIEARGDVKIESFSTGFKTLDDILENVEKGELITLGGYPNMGKTPFMLNLMSNLVNKNIESLFLTYEIEPEILVRRLNKEKNPNAFKFFLPKKTVSKNIKWVHDRIIEAKIKYGTKFVFIDHLDYITPVPKGDNEERVIRETMIYLKHDICVNEGLSVMVAAHVNRSERNMLKAPEMNQFKGSSAIEGQSDVVLVIHKIPDDGGGRMSTDDEGDPKYEQMKSKLYVRKSRRMGGGKSMRLIHDPVSKLFHEPESFEIEKFKQPQAF